MLDMYVFLLLCPGPSMSSCEACYPVSCRCFVYYSVLRVLLMRLLLIGEKHSGLLAKIEM